MEIINIGNRIVNNYLIKTKQGYIVVDTGYLRNYKQFKVRLAQNSIMFEDIKFIFITHVHDDHVGFLNELIIDTNAKLIMHKDSVKRLLLGHNEYIGGCPNVMAKLFIKGMQIVGIGKHTFPIFRINNNTILWDGTYQFFRQIGLNIDIIPLPGHTRDSIGLLTGEGVLLCGDACMNGFPSIKRNIIWIENLEDYKESWDIMIQSSAKMIYPSHGEPFSKKDLIKYCSYLNRIRLFNVKF